MDWKEQLIHWNMVWNHIFSSNILWASIKRSLCINLKSYIRFWVGSTISSSPKKSESRSIDVSFGYVLNGGSQNILSSSNVLNTFKNVAARIW